MSDRDNELLSVYQQAWDLTHRITGSNELATRAGVAAVDEFVSHSLIADAPDRDPQRLYRDGGRDDQVSVVCDGCGAQYYWPLTNGELHLSPAEMGCHCAKEPTP